MSDPVGSIVNLVNGWQSHFFSADRDMRWLFAELEHSMWLTPNTLLVGKIDAGGEWGDELFFGEWKTANPREKNTWKQVWRLNPQSLTYGLLAGDHFKKTLGRECNRFLVRKAFKSNPTTYDQAWYTYTPEELADWRTTLIGIANEIRAYGGERIKHWPTNWDNCFKFGMNYACPHFEESCSKMKWDVPADTIRRVSHLETERRLNETNPLNLAPRPRGEICENELVVLDATRVKTWLGCRERFRREYVENVATPVGEALEIGIAFHEAVAQIYKAMVNT